MSIQAHITAMRDKHAEFEALIAEERTRPLPDMVKLSRLKKQKLHLKEEIYRLLHEDDLPASQAS